MSLNKSQLIGRVGKDPEIRNLEGDNKIASFSLATSEKFKDKNGDKKEVTEWHNIVIFGNLAGIVEKYVNKGDLLYIEGAIKTRSWDDKEGNKKYTTEIVLNNFKGELQMLGSKQSDSNKNQHPAGDHDDLPY